MNKDRLQVAFQYVRQTFFPRWDKKGEWKVEYHPEWKNRKHGAICHEDVRLIWFYEIPKDDDILHLYLIHEICHVKTLGHGKKWAENMAKAYHKALSNVNVSKNLAGFIDHDIQRHFKERR